MITEGQVHLLIFISIILISAIWLFALFEVKKTSYKNGQIDAMNGKIKIKLVEFEDGEREYYYEKDLKDLIEYTVIK